MACAAIVFATLYQAEEHYPVAAVRNYTPLTDSPFAPSSLNSAPTETALAQPDPILPARNEASALEQFGTRNYIEFSFAKSSSFQRVGPLQIRVGRFNSHNGTLQVSVLSDRRRIDYRRVKLNQRIFIPTAYTQGVEMIVNSVSGNKVSGYISEPRDKTQQLRQDPNKTVVRVL